jgi:hypothetical protein
LKPQRISKYVHGEKVARNAVPKSSVNSPLSVHLISFNLFLILRRIYHPTWSFRKNKWMGVLYICLRALR